MVMLRALIRFAFVLIIVHLFVVSCSAVPIQFGETISGTIDSVGEVDSYSFDATAGDRVFLRMQTEGNHPPIRVYASNGAELILTYLGYDDMQVLSLPDSGTYTVLVGDVNNPNIGLYTFYLQQINNPADSQVLTFGETSTGTIETRVQMGTYTVDAMEGDALQFRMHSSWHALGKGEWMVLFAPDGSLVTKSSVSNFWASFSGWMPGGEISAWAPQTGTHTLLVGGGGSVSEDITGDYSLYGQRTNNPGNTIPVEFGETVSGSIAAAAQMDTYTFTAAANDYVYLRVGAEGSSPSIYLFAPNGTKLAVTSFGYDSQCGVSLPDSGMYTVLIGDVNDSYAGSYTFYLQRTNNPANAQALTFGGTRNGTLETRAQMDAYTFDAIEGDTLLFRMSSSWHASEKGEWLMLYAPDGSLVTCSKELSFWGGWMPEGFISARALQTGMYTLLVGGGGSAWDNTTGTYNLFGQRTNNPGNAVPIEFGETVSGSIADAVRKDTYTFTAAANDHVFLRMQADWIYDPQILVYAPNGTELASISSTYDCHADLSLPDSGTYTVLVGDKDSLDTGSYTLFLQRTNNPADAQAFVFGEVSTGTIETRAQMDTYTVDAMEGDALLFLMSSSWHASEKGEWLMLYAPDGSLVTCSQVYGYYSWSPEGSISARALQTGTYTLLVGSGGSIREDITGTYSVFGQRTNNPSNAIYVNFDEIVNGTIDSALQIDTYSFNATAGDRVFLRLQAEENYPSIRMYAPNGTELASKSLISDDYMQAWSLPDSGTYTVLLGDVNNPSIGSYTFYLQRINNPADAQALTFGETSTGTIETRVQMGTHTIDAMEGDTLLFRMSSSWHALGKGEWMVLFAPDGSMVTKSQISNFWSTFSGWMPGGDITARAPQTGTYTLLVGGGGSVYEDISGNYSVYGQRTNNPGNAIPFEFGGTVSGSINDTAQMDTYTLMAAANDHVILRMQADRDGTYVPPVHVYAPNGTELAITSDWYDQCVDVNLPESGTYTILIGYMDHTNTGAYSLYLQRTNNPVNATPIEYGERRNGSIDPVLIDAYTFFGEAKDSIFIWMESSQDTGTNRILQLYAPSGTLVAKLSDPLSREISAILPETGTYTILTACSDGTGYFIFLEGYRATPLAAGQIYKSSVLFNKWQYYSIKTFEGDDLVIQIVPFDTAADLEVYGMYGKLPNLVENDLVQKVKNPQGAYDLIVSPAQDGTYYFGVYGSNTAERANYTIKASINGLYASTIYPRAVSNQSATRIHVYGLGFVNGMRSELRQANTTSIAAYQALLASNTTLFTYYDLANISLGTYDVAVIWPDGSERVLSAALQVNDRGGALYSFPDQEAIPGAPTNYSISVPDAEDLYIMLIKTHYQWEGRLSLYRDGALVSDSTGNQDQILHIINPEQGEYMISTSSFQYEKGILSVWTALPELPIGNWVVGTIHRPYGSVFYQVDVPPNQDTLSFKAEAMGDWSHFTVYYNQFGGSTRWMSSYGADASLTITDPAPGRYLVEFVDNQLISGETQNRDVMIRVDTVAHQDPISKIPFITGITPDRGGVSGSVTIFVRGKSLDSNGTVLLSRYGYENITATSLEQMGDYGVLARFDLSNRDPGSYSVEVINPDGLSATSPVSFTIENGGTGEFWAELEGRGEIRVGRPATYVLKYGNRGTVDMPAPLVEIGISPASENVLYGVQAERNFSSTWYNFHIGQNNEETGLSSVKEWRPLDTPVTILTQGPSYNTGILPAGYSATLYIYIRSDQSEPFSLQISPLVGDPTYSPGTVSSSQDAFSLAPGLPLALSRSYPGGYSEYLGPFGYGWFHSFDLRLETLAGTGIALKNSGQYIETFTRGWSHNNYTSLGGDSTLIPNADGTYSLENTDSPTLKFRSDMLLDSIRDLNGNTLKMVYNSQKQLIEIRHSSGDSIILEYNTQGRINRVTEPDAHTIEYSYDPSGTLLVSVSASDGSVTRYGYVSSEGAYGLASITTPDGTIQHISHDGSGRVTEDYVNDGEESIRYSYDSGIRTTTITDALGAESAIQVNEFGQMIYERSPVGAQILYEYDCDQNLVRTTDAMGSAYRMAYDIRGNLIRTTNPLDQSITMEYDIRLDTLSAVTDARGNTIRMAYDDHGNMERITHPDASFERMEYDGVGNLVERTTRKGDTIKYTYNPQGQITRKDYPDGLWVAYVYDQAGNILSASDASGTTSMQYNTKNQMVQVEYPNGYWFNYTYDDAGRLVKKLESAGYLQYYEYDNLGHLIHISNEKNEDVVRYTYDSVGRLTRKILPNNAFTTYEYDAAGQMIHLINYNVDGSILSRFDYTYDLIGNPCSMDTLEGQYAYEYDAIGQLTKVVYPDGHSTSYSYDAAGNRVSVIDSGKTTGYNTNTMNQYTQVGSESYTYDLNGNLISKDEGWRTITYEYNTENRLMKVTSPEGIWEFQYDVLGNRIGMVHNGTEYRYIVDPIGLGNVVSESYGNGTPIARYTYGIGLISQIDPDRGEYAYFFNSAGHTVQIIDSSGRVVNRYDYSPYGESQEKIEGIKNPFTYGGQFGIQEDHSGLFYMRMRYFTPQLGRFITEDTVYLPGTNLYSYCYNNPIRWADPTGRIPVVVMYWIYTIGFWCATHPEETANIMTNIIELIKPELNSGSSGTPIDFGFWLMKEMWNHWDENHNYYMGFVDDYIFGMRGYYQMGDLICGYMQSDLDTTGRYISPKGSVDPEDKYGPNGFDQPNTPQNQCHRYIQPLSTFSYRVDFWNAENATAPVCDVDAYDQLDTNLNWSTFRFTEVGFINWTIPMEPTQYFNAYVDMRPEKDLIVNIEGRYNPGTGMANLTYQTLDPITLQTPEDPLAGFLPPITDSGHELGWFSYEVDPEQGLTTGTVIENRAWVNFDYTQHMPAPKDAPWRNTIDSGKPSSSLTAALASQTEIVLTLSGSDDASGVKDYTIYASMDGGTYQSYLKHITGTTAAFTCLPEHTYRFYSVAADNVGNVEDVPSSPDATITVPARLSANFWTNRTLGVAPLAVQFTDTSMGSPTGWNWTFGDGDTSAEQHPVHSYTAAGNYTVTLTVSNSIANSTLTRAGYVSIIPAPEITGMSPSVGYSNGTLVRATITGTGFVECASIRLIDSGKPDIAATNVTLISPSKITCTIALADAEPGVRSARVANPAGGSDILADTFTIRLRGDFNGVGGVDIGDVAKVAYMVVGKEPQDLEADFNRNGIADIGDASKIAYYFVGKTPIL